MTTLLPRIIIMKKNIFVHEEKYFLSWK